MTVLRLRPSQAPQVRALLAREPDTNLYMLSALHRWGLAHQDGVSWWGFQRGGALRAVVWLGRPVPDPGGEVAAGLGVPWGSEQGCRAIGGQVAAHGPPRMVIGPRAASDALWKGLWKGLWEGLGEGLGGAPARIWYDQRLYVCTAPSPGPRLSLRVARPDEIPLVADLSAAMMAEDLGADPRAEDPEEHLRRTRARVLSGRCLLGTELGKVVFKVDLGSTYRDRVQVGGTYVVPQARGRGLGAAGMRALYDILAGRTPRVSLHVNEANHAAVRTYDRAGFTPAAAFRLASR